MAGEVKEITLQLTQQGIEKVLQGEAVSFHFLNQPSTFDLHIVKKGNEEAATETMPGTPSLSKYGTGASPPVKVGLTLTPFTGH